MQFEKLKKMISVKSDVKQVEIKELVAGFCNCL